MSYNSRDDKSEYWKSLFCYFFLTVLLRDLASNWPHINFRVSVSIVKSSVLVDISYIHFLLISL